MKPFFFEGFRMPFGGAAGKNWSSYWATLTYAERVALFEAYAHWPLNDASGTLANELIGNKADESYNLNQLSFIVNPGFETAGEGGADVFAGWTEGAGDGAIADETTIVHSGSHSCKLTGGASNNCRIWYIHYVSLDIYKGKQFTFKFWTRGDGTNAGQWRVYDVTHAAYIRTLVSTGVTGTEWTEVTGTFTVPSGAGTIEFWTTFWCPSTNGGVAYFDDYSLTYNDIPLTGLIASSGVTYGEEGMGDGNTALKFSGENTFVDIGTSGVFQSFWNGNVGSAVGWGKIAADGWTADDVHRYIFHTKADNSNLVYIAFGKQGSPANTLGWKRRVISDPNWNPTYTFDEPPTGWFCMGMVWDLESSPKRIACFLYVNGTFIKVSDAAPTTGNETWDKETYPVKSDDNILMAGSNTAQEWIGWGANISVYDKVLTDAQMEAIMKP